MKKQTPILLVGILFLLLLVMSFISELKYREVKRKIMEDEEKRVEKLISLISSGILVAELTVTLASGEPVVVVIGETTYTATLTKTTQRLDYRSILIVSTVTVEKRIGNVTRLFKDTWADGKVDEVSPEIEDTLQKEYLECLRILTSRYR